MGATLAAAVPPDDYWPAIAEVCRRHGVLLIADEVMTGFGRTGTLVRRSTTGGSAPDLLVAAKGATSGYWPFGFVAASGEVHDAVTGPGAASSTGSPTPTAPVGAAVAREVLRILRGGGPRGGQRGEGRPASRRCCAGSSTSSRRSARSAAAGCWSGIELVADRATRRPFPRAARVAEAVVAAARERGVLVYSGTGNADGTDGDTILLGPPFVVTDDELVRIAEVVAEVDRRRPRREVVAPAALGAPRGGQAVSGRAVPAQRPAQQQRDAQADQRERQDQPADLGRDDVDPAEEGEQSAEPGLPAHATAGRGPDRGDEQEGDPKDRRSRARRARRPPRSGRPGPPAP